MEWGPLHSAHMMQRLWRDFSTARRGKGPDRTLVLGMPHGGWRGGGGEGEKMFVYLKWASSVWLSVKLLLFPPRNSFSVLGGWVGGSARSAPPTSWIGIALQLLGATGRDALEGRGPQRWPYKRVDRRLEEVAKAVGGGYCRLQMPLKLALGVRDSGWAEAGRPGGGAGTSLPSNASLATGVCVRHRDMEPCPIDACTECVCLVGPTTTRVSSTKRTLVDVWPRVGVSSCSVRSLPSPQTWSVSSRVSSQLSFADFGATPGLGVYADAPMSGPMPNGVPQTKPPQLHHSAYDPRLVATVAAGVHAPMGPY